MSGSLIPNAKQQYFDANGNPLAGGFVYYYIPGTTTFKNTYQDAALTILNSNPIILDSAGECITYGDGSYRQIVTDVNGNLIWDQPTVTCATVSYVDSKIAALGTMAVQNASSVTITGGTMNGVTGTNSGMTVGTATNATNATNLVSGGTIASNVTGVTQSAGDNSTKVATTAYVASAVSSLLTIGTIQSSTSGTSIAFTGLPSGIKRIVVAFNGVSTSGSSPIIVQLGTSGGLTTSGYSSYVLYNGGGTSATNGLVTTGIGAGDFRYGQMIINSMGSNIWAEDCGYTVGTNGGGGGGGVTLSGALTQLSITTVNGTDTFDAGLINILYE